MLVSWIHGNLWYHYYFSTIVTLLPYFLLGGVGGLTRAVVVGSGLGFGLSVIVSPPVFGHKKSALQDA